MNFTAPSLSHKTLEHPTTAASTTLYLKTKKRRKQVEANRRERERQEWCRQECLWEHGYKRSQRIPKDPQMSHGPKHINFPLFK
jgi:hypothetical protein